jgi:hypothetical protein
MIDLFFIYYALGETLCYARADENCEADGIPELVSAAQQMILEYDEKLKERDSAGVP